jgi:5-methylcytosine-specific restriction endonuclease McrA
MKSYSRRKIINKKFRREKLIKFYLSFWKNNKQRNCFNCGIFLGNEPKLYMFDHILPKSRYRELMYEPGNIVYLCMRCHDLKTRGFLSEKMKKLVEETANKFNIK